MKKLDRLLISSFIGPFIVTFMIAMFVLLMQILWLYIDDIAGKGLGFFILIELIAYKCVGLIPMALPLAILISSVMVLGGMAEHYELSSFKSAGVRLLRIMRPLIVFAFCCTIFSYICSNNLIPVANLKFGSRMYDIQRQKPALRLDAGVFNDDFDNYAIHIGRKGANDRTIEDIIMYDHSDASRGLLTEITAKSGEMFTTDDGHYFVMHLRDGHQYIETSPTSVRGGGSHFPFVRTSYKSWTKIFDLSEFQLARTNEELFKQNRSMLSSAQLRVAIDSITIRILERRKNLSNQVAGYFTFMPLDSTFLKETTTLDSLAIVEAKSRVGDTSVTVIQDTLAPDTVQLIAPEVKPDTVNRNTTATVGTVDTGMAKFERLKGKVALDARTLAKKQPLSDRVIKLFKDVDTTGNFQPVIDMVTSRNQAEFYSKARSSARGIQSQAESAIRTLDGMRESKVKHIYELHTKYSMAVVCMIFIFIGAPMGAIVRKGGFGYPILVSIIFFMLFVVLTIFCRKIAETFVLPAAMAGWIPCAILFPIGLVLTRKAMNDSKLVNTDRYAAFFRKIFKKKENNSEEQTVA
ncbi:MAG: LptF/LptG family permease [Saprospiraceae bacterium]|nr:LptF/LptG family permease [Lewinella sp.]